MSPSESELRAALRAGEPDGATPALSARAIIARAEHIREQRRRRVVGIGGGVAAALVVAGIAVGVHAATGPGSPDGVTAAGSAMSRAGADAGGEQRAAVASPLGTVAAGPDMPADLHRPPGLSTTAGRVANPAASSSAPTAQIVPLPTTSAGCPAAPPVLRLGSGAPTALFARPVATLRVCRYGPGPSARELTAAALLTGADAARVATDLDRAAAGASGTLRCPPAAGRDTVVLEAADTVGRPLPVVELTADCTVVRDGQRARAVGTALDAALATARP